MEESFEHTVYSPNVIEFVTVSREFLNWLENAPDQTRQEFINTALKILPLLYLKANMLPRPETMLDEFVEKFVNEDDYETIRLQINAKMGRFDDYLEVFTAEMERSDLPLSSSVSENMADIYQDLKDFLLNYRSAVTEIMNDSLVELLNQFEAYWGQRLVNVLRALHQVYYSGEDLQEADEGTEQTDDSVKSTKDHWFISKRQQEWRDNSSSDKE